METYNTKYGKISLYKNEVYIGEEFKHNRYWDEHCLLQLKPYIDPSKNILEIGAHCGTSSIVYASFLNPDKKVFVYEPQLKLYNLLVHNINQNNLHDKIIPFNKGVFCFEGEARMDKMDIDGYGGEVSKRYNEEKELPCNFGGVCLGKDGETISITTIDSMNLEDLGLIHCDAQGAENFIFSKAINTIVKHRPLINFEDNFVLNKKLFNAVSSSYPEYGAESLFDIKKYCLENLNYSKKIDRFHGGLDTLLIP